MSRTKRLSRASLLLVGALLLSACDRYIEEVRVQDDGSIEFVASGTVVCADPLAEQIWGEDPCPALDAASRGGAVDLAPFGFQPNLEETSLVAEGEQDRRRVEVAWNGPVEELATVFAGSAETTVLTEKETEIVVSIAGSPGAQFAADPALVEEAERSRWPAGEFRIVAPDKVEEHNGDRIQGRIVIWDIGPETPDELRVMWTTEDPPSRIWWFAIGSAITFGVLILMVLIEGPRREAARRAELS